ncbi:tRNA pseudouridine(55) synthase TruB [Marinospirillum sp. MEB164]|uniref:tRNA pseudouridine synthase B n=1 Tax=Marinospirillum alkalitolerans TaxID=3123374 RepID=A0ABW8PZK6_9GAMM
MDQAAPSKKLPQKKVLRREVNGILLLDKPLGKSSNQVLQRVRWMLKAQKGGHTGNLDPLASGVLPLCFGEATKFARFGLDADKTYITRIQLGEARSTGDAEGEVIARAPLPVLSRERLEALLASFVGKQQQVPPMYSALKHQGQKLYEIARAGQEVERPARAIELHQLTLLDFGDDWLEVQVRCSKGTYIRVLGEDLARALGSCGYLAALRRIESGGIEAHQLVTLEALEADFADADEDQHALEPYLQPVDFLLQHLPLCRLTSTDAEAVLHGQPVAAAPYLDPPFWQADQLGQDGARSDSKLDAEAQMMHTTRLYSPTSEFLGLGEYQPETGWIQPKKMCRSPIPVSCSTDSPI